MSNIVLTDAYVSIAANVLTGIANSVSIDYSAAAQDDTAFGDTTKSSIGGLKDWTIKVDINQDYANAAVDSILFPLVGTTVSFEIRPTSSAVGTSNPKYTGTGLITAYNPISGKVGDKAASSFTLVPGGATPTLTRATA
jgi:hypothetical protein